jgi:hypothetical protein
MNYRRLMLCGATTCFMTLAVPHAAAADDGQHATTKTTDCQEVDNTGNGSHNDGHDGHDGHDAGERDREHQYDGYNRYQRSKRHRHGPVHVRHHPNHHNGHDDDCVIEPPVEVAEAPLALLLPASGVMTGGATVLVVRRRSRNAILKQR